MEQRVSQITLGVADIASARRFYEVLGWRGQEVGETAFFQAGVADSGADGFGGVALVQNVRSREEVDAVMAAGASVTKPAGKAFYGGYAGYFTDPDNHAWEIAWNPGFKLAADGSLELPGMSGG